MRVVITSDLHGFLPEIPECDLLVIAGDVCPAYDHSLDFQHQWLLGSFRKWIDDAPAKRIVGTWGNHDLIAENQQIFRDEDPVTFLLDQAIQIDGVRIYGSPWQPRFFDWAFNLDLPELAVKFSQIPDCDILITHCPPLWYGDSIKPGSANLGSEALLKKIDEIQPKLCCFGHIHGGYGCYHRNNSMLVNGAHCNEHYQPVNKPILINL